MRLRATRADRAGRAQVRRNATRMPGIEVGLETTGRISLLGNRREAPPRVAIESSGAPGALLHFCAIHDMLLCMRTTIEISSELFRQAKKRAADEGASLRKIIEDALRSYLSKRPSRPGYKLQWRPEKGQLRPGVNLDDRDSLLDIMEGRT
jgi:hypothetical protein